MNAVYNSLKCIFVTIHIVHIVTGCPGEAWVLNHLRFFVILSEFTLYLYPADNDNRCEKGTVG